MEALRILTNKIIHTHIGYVLPAVGQNNWWYLLIHGAPRTKSPLSSAPKINESAVHNIYELIHLLITMELQDIE